MYCRLYQLCMITKAEAVYDLCIAVDQYPKPISIYVYVHPLASPLGSYWNTE